MPEKQHLITNVSFKNFWSEKNTDQPAHPYFEEKGMYCFLGSGIPIKNVPYTYDKARVQFIPMLKRPFFLLWGCHAHKNNIWPERIYCLNHFRIILFGK